AFAHAPARAREDGARGFALDGGGGQPPSREVLGRRVKHSVSTLRGPLFRGDVATTPRERLRIFTPERVRAPTGRKLIVQQYWLTRLSTPSQEHGLRSKLRAPGGAGSSYANGGGASFQLNGRSDALADASRRAAPTAELARALAGGAAKGRA